MKRIKKIVLFLVILLGTIFIFQYTSNAHNVGNIGLGGKDNLNYSSLSNSSDLYCVEHGGPLRDFKNIPAGFQMVNEEKNICWQCMGPDKNGKWIETWFECTGPTVYDHSNHNHRAKKCGSYNEHSQAGPKHYYLEKKPNTEHFHQQYATQATTFPYTVKDVININESLTISEGNKAGSQQKGLKDSDSIAQMAYILAHGSGYKGNFWEGEYSEAQMAIYRIFDDFADTIGWGKEWKHSDSTFGSNNEANNNVLKGSREYSENLKTWRNNGNEVIVSNGAEKVEISLNKYKMEYYEESYLKVGPFNWTFPFAISSVQIDGIKSVRYLNEEGGKTNIGGIDKIISGKNFWILIPASDGISASKVKMDVKLTNNITVYGATVKLLEHEYSGDKGYAHTQRLMYGEGWSKELEGKASFNYSLNMAEFKLKKVDENIKEIVLPNVEFKIKHKATGLYVSGEDAKIKYTLDEDKARIFNTDNKGEFVVRNIASGKYEAEEIKNPNFYYPSNPGIIYTIKATAGKQIIYTATNSPDKGDLKIIKEDVMYKDSKSERVKMGKVGFKLQNQLTKKWVTKKDGKLEYNTVEEKNATEFITNDNGEIIIKGILTGKYWIKETSNEYEDKKDNNNLNYRTNIGMKKTITVEPYTHTGKKYNNIENIYNVKAPKSVKISGYVWQFKKIVDGKGDSIEHINNSRYNNLSDKLYSEEFKSEVFVRLYKTQELVIEEDKNKYPTNAYMRPINKYMDIVSGNSTQTGEYMEAINEKYMENSIANLPIEEYTEEKYVGTAKIDPETGKYSFEITGIRYPEIELPYYKIRFTYNGFDYEAAVANYDDSNLPKENKSGKAYVGRSKATENSEERRMLNQTFAIISGNDSQNENWNEKGTETYGSAWNIHGKTNVKDENKTANITYSFNPGKEKTQKGTSKFKKIEFVDQMFPLNVTATYSLKPGDQNLENKGYSNYYAKDSTGNTYGEVKRINLGLKERSMPDLSTSTQIENVVTSVNGYNNLYKTTRKKNDPDGSDLKIGVTYVENEEKLSNFTVYPSDVQTWANDSEISDKLRVYITYKVSISNQTKGELYNRIRELGIYYDQNYELKFIGTDLDTDKNNYSAKGNLYPNGTNNRYYYDVNTTNCVRYSNNTIEGFKKAYIDLSKLVDYVIGPGESKYVYLTYKVADGEIQKMLTEANYIPTMKNIVEINAYSTYSKETATNNDLYAGIDLDSAPGNIKSTKVQEMDDDTDLARAFKISQKDDENSERTLTGKVFLDKTDDKLNSSKERKGDSIYNKKDDKELNNLEIKLIGKAGVKSKNVVEGTETKTTKTEYKATVKGTDQNGNEITLEGDNTYFISGFIPGDYTVQYKYNNKTYYYNEKGEKVTINTIDYKSAIVKDETKDSTTTKIKTTFKAQKSDKTQHTDWYKLDNPTNSTQTAESFVRYNEAVDDWNKRNSIDERYKNVTMKNTGEKSKEENTDMTATTPVMEISVELNSTSGADSYTPAYYNISNIDFGITERPRQALKVIKNVTNLRLTLANGQVLEDATITKNKNGKLVVKGTKKGITAGSATEDSRGFVKLELDSELIHGSTLEIVYDMKTTNISEKDYELEDYYKYGEITDKSKIVKITPTILDYASNKLTYERDTIVEHGKTEGENRNNAYYDWNKKELDDTLIVGGEKYKLKDLFNKNQVLYKEEKNGNVVDIKKDHINTMLVRTLGEDLAPGEDSEIIKLGLSKLLSNDNEDMTYNNDVEVINANKTWGRTIYKQLGTYIFENESGIGGSAEEVIITPPTGLSENNITYYILVISGLLSIVASGLVIVLIKHKK